MIKLIISDLDGVLIRAKEIHYQTLNRAIASVDSKFEITMDEHLSIFDGLPTKKKLVKLSELKGLPTNTHEYINSLKQKYTLEAFQTGINHDLRLQSVLKDLKSKNYTIYVASNSMRESIKIMLLRTGLLEYIDYYLSNEDVKQAKPHAEIYLKAMIHAGVEPSETLIIEDSPHGRLAAARSGAFVCGVDFPEDLTTQHVMNCIEKAESKPHIETWSDNKMNVLIPMAGHSKDFEAAGYTVPRYLLPLNNEFLIHQVIRSIGIDANYTYIVDQEENKKYNYNAILNSITPCCIVIEKTSPNDGAAETTLLAKSIIDNNNHLVVCFADQILKYNAPDFIYNAISRSADASVLTFEAGENETHWSFAEVQDGQVKQIAEKKRISNIGTCGLYYFNTGHDYVVSAELMITKNIRTNGYFYVAPVLNEMILMNKKILAYPAGMKSLGTPELYVKPLTIYT